MSPLTVAIIGGGPAGSAASIALLRAMAGCRQSVSVVLIDSLANPDQEPVGETIPPAATPVLRQLGCLDLLESDHHLECPGSASIWGSDEVGYNDFSFNPIGKGYHLNRQRFDSDLLAKAVSTGCQVNRGWHLRRVRQHDRGYELECLIKNPSIGTAPTRQKSKQRASLVCDFVVDASGKSSAFTRRIGVARNVFDEVISLCAFFDLPAIDAWPPARTLVQTQENGWWYAARLPNDKAIVAFCTDAEEIKRHHRPIGAEDWHHLFNNATWLSGECEKQFGAAVGVPGRLVLKPAPSAILSAVTGEGWLAVGDAASSYDSLTSAGITKAISSGEIAGKAVAHWLRNQDREPLAQYQNRVFEEFNRYLQLHAYHYHNEQRYAHCDFWRRRRRM
jgi:flavin-dependent dehydrogenase